MNKTLPTPTPQAVDFDPFAGPAISHLSALTASQAEIWLAGQLGGPDASRAYNESVSLRLQGELNEEALRTALQALAQRHEALRATVSADGRLLCVLAEAPVALACLDLSGELPEAQEEAVARHAAEHAHHVFDLLAGPVWRASLLTLSPERFHFTLTAHHIICDGWSLGILLQDLGQLYSAAVRGEAAALPPAVPFSAYADQEALAQDSVTYQQAMQYWLTQFRDGGPVLGLPTDFPRAAVRSYRSQQLNHQLPPALVGQLRAMGIEAGCSLVTTLLAVFEVLLFKLTGQEDVVVGLPTAGQPAAGMPALVGHCVNLLPLRSRPVGSRRFSEYLQARKTELFDALEHQQLTFGRLLKQLPLRREAGRLPLVAVLFNVDLGMADGVAFASLDYELVSNPRAFENFELSLNASGAGNHLVLECAYNASLFRPERIQAMLADFERIAEQVVANPEQLLADLRRATPAMPEAYAALNATQAAYPSATLTELIQAQARANPQHLAVKFGATELSYATLNERADALAAALQARQLGPGDLVGLALERTADLLVAVLAVLKCGAAYVPLDPAYPTDRIAFMLTDSTAKLLLASTGALPDLRTDTPRLAFEELLAEAAAQPGRQPTPVQTGPDDLLYVLYTSGSTGQPKGVAVTHRNVVNFLTSMQQQPGITAADRLLAVTTISFDIAGLELFLPLVSGATVVLADADTVRDGRALLQLLETERITLLQATPATWHLLLAAGWEQPLPLVALCGGEPLPPALASQLLTRCRALWNMYGPTETTIWSSVKQIVADQEPITVGRPIANTQLYVLDEQLQALPPGQPGEVYIGGDGVARGYWQRPGLTAERFIANPFRTEPGARLYRTGDAGQLLPNGELQVLGRLDEQLKLRGYRIEPGEIEAHLTRLPGIRQAVVVVQASATDQRLVAHVVLDQPAELSAHRPGWLVALRAQLPAYMVPAEFVALDALPLTANGKVNRRALQQAPAAGHQAPAVSAAPAVGYVAPRTNVEQMVADIWSELLGVKPLGIYDNFFDLGGHSLIAVQIMARLEKATGKRLPLASLFTHPTVAALALLLQLDGKSITWDSLVPIKPTGSKTPLYIVHGGGLNVLLFNALARNMHPEQPVYGLQAKGLNGVDEPLDRIEDMAAYYVAAIQVQNPEGPYALAGYSFGGIIAYEMSRQLLAQGKQVKILAMFDTYAYQANLNAPRLVRAAETAAGTLMNFLYTFVLLAQDPKRTIAYKKEQLTRKLADVARRFGKRHDFGLGDFGYSPVIDERNEEAERAYILTPTPVVVELFRAKKRTFYMPDAAFLGWKPFALKGVQVHDIPGEHNYIFAPPNDEEFAAILQAVLDKATA